MANSTQTAQLDAGLDPASMSFEQVKEELRSYEPSAAVRQEDNL
jgi:hypothetical protein